MGTFAAVYEAAAEAANGQCPIEAGVILNLIDNECEHEFLPGDPVRWCSCWPNPPSQPPTYRPPAISAGDAEEIDMMTIEPVSTREAIAAEREEEEAPYGRKADGTPRKRPAPSAEQIAKAQAARRANAEKRSQPAITRDDAGEMDYIARLRAEMSSRIAQLEDELAKVRAAMKVLG